jgi:hypothetical protein
MLRSALLFSLRVAGFVSCLRATFIVVIIIIIIIIFIIATEFRVFLQIYLPTTN